MVRGLSNPGPSPWRGMRQRARMVGIFGLALACFSGSALAFATPPSLAPPPASADLEIVDASVAWLQELDLLTFTLDVAGDAGATTVTAHGAVDGAPVLGYVVPTSLPPEAVGFAAGEGIVALAITAHPDFDDTPFWDENFDHDYTNDGAEWHTHWVLVGPDDRVPGGLAVLAADGADAIVPPTNPGLPIALDSPGFPVRLDGATMTVAVPVARIRGERDFTFDAASVYLEVNTEDTSRPFLGVYDVYGVLSGDLSLPYAVTTD